MPTAIHRTERDSLGVPVTNSFSPDEVIDPEVWLVNPSLSAVLNVDRRYWKIVNDQVVEMSPAEKDIADGAILAALKSEQQKRLKADADGLILSKYSVAEISNLLALYADSI